MTDPGALSEREVKVYEQDGYTVTVSKGTPGVVAKIERDGRMVGVCYDFHRPGRRYFASTEIGSVWFGSLKEAVAATINYDRNPKPAPMPKTNQPPRVSYGTGRKWHERKDFG